MSLRGIAKRFVITTSTKKGQRPSPATVMRMLREHDERATAAAAAVLYRARCEDCDAKYPGHWRLVPGQQRTF